MKKRISRKEWAEIGRYNHAAKWLRPFCSYTLIKESDTAFKREQRVCLIPYLLICIPIHIAQAFYCILDGGLREFELYRRFLGYDVLVKGELAYERAEKIWSGKLAE